MSFDVLRTAGDTTAEITAEAHLAAARERDAGLAQECLGYEVLCRSGAAWSALDAGELDAAEGHFRSMGELLPRGLEWRYQSGGDQPDPLPSGVAGLTWVADGWAQREDWGRAALVFEELRALQPDLVDWHNNAAFFHRDAGVALEFEAQRLCAAAGGALAEEALAPLRAALEIPSELHGTPGEVERFQAAAAERLTRAHEHLQQSSTAYDEAARLAAEDVRVVNDTALVLVYYLHRDLERAEDLLMRCVRLGEEQLLVGDLDEQARWELENAWGDAFQNLGVLHLVHRNDPAAARRFFERSVEIGPEPRPLVGELWLVLCDRIEAGADPAEALSEAPESRAILHWGAPCDS